MNRLWLACGLAGAALLGLNVGVARAQTGFSITGGMSNFDCTNETDDSCDEFEVEIEGIHPEDVVHTYRNGNYGSPTITLSADGMTTIVDYRSPAHTTAVHAVEHFGISLRQLSAAAAIRGRWMKNGRPATVNGQVPQPGGGTTPATQPLLPTIDAQMDIGSLGGDAVTVTVTNNDPSQAIWVKRRASVSQGVVTLESLMSNNAVVTTAVQIDAGPFLIPAGASVSYTNDLIELEDNESVVFAAEYSQDLFTGGLFNPTHTRGPVLGNVMTASIASPGTGCDVSSPTIIEQPISQERPLHSTVNLRINADGNDLTLSYQWMREGVALVNSSKYAGVTTDELSIEDLDSTTEGLYSCRISNTCGSIVTSSALVYVIGHNNPPVRPVCAADFNSAGGVTVQDIFDFLSAWFAGSAQADFNHADGVTVQDIFDFLTAWFTGCP